MAEFIPQSRPTVGLEESQAISAVLKSGQLAMGPVVSDFEKKFSEFMKVPYALAVNSGTSALHLALLALGVKRDTEVIIPSYTCTALLNVVNYVGARPTIADIDPDTLCLCSRNAKRKITRRTSAIIAVHNFGIPADIGALSSLGVPVIEDCAHSLGGRIKNKRMGILGTIAIYSFYPTKMITTGEGGMAVTYSAALARKIRDIRTYDSPLRYSVRYNYKMSEVAAAMGKAQLSKLESFIKRRKAIAKIYDAYFQGRAEVKLIQRDFVSGTYYRYIIFFSGVKAADRFINDMAVAGIVCDRPVYKPLHRYLGLSEANFPVTSRIYRSAVSVPLYPSLTDAEIGKIINACDKVLNNE